MMLERITESEIEFMEALCYSPAFIECMFNDIDSMHVFTEDQFSDLRSGQMLMPSFEYIVDDNDTKISKKQNFKRVEKAGTLYCLGARKYGKTAIALLGDMVMSIVHHDNWETLFSSYDAVHIDNVMERLITIIERHPIIKLFTESIKRAPGYVLMFKNGMTIQSINTNINSKAAGANFFGKHVKKHWQDEWSKETEEVEGKRIDATAEVGCINRFCGMTDFTKHTPAGKVFYNKEFKRNLLNFAQYISPMWDEKEKKDAVRNYSGEQTINYRVFVKGEVVEDGISVFDMKRINLCIDDRKQIKHFEINKDTFGLFKNIIVVSRPSNAEQCAIAADIGETAATEIIIFFKINDKWHYTYNISLYNLTDKEQYEVFKWLRTKLNCEFYSNDQGEGTGRAIYRRLEEDFGKDAMVYYAGAAKVAVGFKKDDKNRIMMKEGKPVVDEEFMSEWAVKHLKDLFYEQQVVIPEDYRFLAQINQVMAIRLTNRIVFDCVATDNHLFDAFKVFAILHWERCSSPVQAKPKKKFAKF